VKTRVGYGPGFTIPDQSLVVSPPQLLLDTPFDLLLLHAEPLACLLRVLELRLRGRRDACKEIDIPLLLSLHFDG